MEEVELNDLISLIKLNRRELVLCFNGKWRSFGTIDLLGTIVPVSVKVDIPK